MKPRRTTKKKGQASGRAGTRKRPRPPSRADEVAALREAESALRDSEERLRLAADAARFGIYTFDFVSGTGYWSPEFKAILGLKADEPVRLDADRLYVGLHPDDRASFLAAMRAANDPRGSGIFQHDYRVMHPARKVRWLHVRGQTSFAGRGSARHAVRAAGVVLDITARKLAEEELRASRQFAQATIDAISTHICVLDAAGKIIAVNRSWREFAAANQLLPREAAEGVNYLAICDAVTGPDAGTAAAFAAGIRAVANGERDSFSLEYPCHSPTERRWFIGRATRFPRPDDAHVVVAHQNITERKQAEAELRDAHESLEEAHQLAHIGVWKWAKKDDVVTWSKELYDIAGRDPGQPAPTHAEHPRFYTQASWARLSSAVSRALTTGEPYDLELELLRPDGSTRCVNACGGVKRGENGEIIGLHGTLQDITERKRAEETLRESQHLLQRVFFTTPVLVYIYDLREQRNLYANRSVVDLLGYTADQVQAMGPGLFLIILHPDDAARVARHHERMLAASDEEVLEIDYRMKHADGQWRWLNSRDAVFLRDEQGKARQILGVATDITERKHAAETLRESEERFRTVYDKAAMGIAVTDPQGTILQANTYFQHMLGRPSEELVGRTFAEFTHPDDGEGERALFLGAMKEGRADLKIQKRYVRNDGRIIWANLTASICRDAAGQPRFVIGVVEDVTERRQAEADLRELSGRLLRLEDDERRRLARELHDTTAQELAAISMNLAVLKSRAPELKAGARAILAETANLTDRCASEIRTMSYLLHPPALEALGLAGAGRDYADGFARRSGIRVDLQISDGFGRLPAEIELALFRVLQESLANIHRHSGSRTASIRLMQTNDEIRLDIQDTGRGLSLAEGVSAEGLPGGSLGVGIPGMRERLRQLGGRLEVESDAHGTCVIAIVPLVAKTDQS